MNDSLDTSSIAAPIREINKIIAKRIKDKLAPYEIIKYKEALIISKPTLISIGSMGFLSSILPRGICVIGNAVRASAIAPPDWNQDHPRYFVKYIGIKTIMHR